MWTSEAGKELSIHLCVAQVPASKVNDGNGADRLAYPEYLSIHTFFPCCYFD